MTLGHLSLADVALIAIRLMIVVASIVAHELCHGLAAYRLGDRTAKDAGRLTLNPLRHLDPFGSVLLPALMAFTGGPIFAYAKPVPYNPANFRNRRRDELLVALAGPAANLVLGVVGVLVMWVAYLVGAGDPVRLHDVRYWVYWFGYSVALINFVLFFFNIIPIPPLDGSSVIAALIPQRYMPVFYRVKSYSMLILIVIVFALPMVLNMDPIGAYFSVTSDRLLDALSPHLTYYVSGTGL